MIDISSLEQYFPNVNKPLSFGKYTFLIAFRQDKETFVINLKIKQQDNKEEQIIKFRLGIGKDKLQDNASHQTNFPHFEIQITRTTDHQFSAIAYFTFSQSDEQKVIDYAKGTIVLIDKIIKKFIENRRIDSSIINQIVYDDAVISELHSFEPVLINALYDCYKNSNLVVRQNNEAITIKTLHNFKKYLGVDAKITELDPLFLPLLKKIENRKKS